MEPAEQYLVVSYKSSGTSYWGYGGHEDYSSGFNQQICYSKEEVINWVCMIELQDIDDGERGFLYTHYLHTPDSIKDGFMDELPGSWQKEIKERVNGELASRVAIKEAARLAKAQEAVIMKEQEERREYEKLRKKYGGFDL